MDGIHRSAAALNGRTIIRILIASYFMAFALKVIPGTDVGILLRPFWNEPAATYAANTAVFISAVAIIFGWQRRMAALVLALILFFASYLTMTEMPDRGLGGFWRDLALIGALMLTYADTESTGNDALTFYRNLPRNRNGKPKGVKTQTKVLSRGSVQNAFEVGSSGRAVSRILREGEAEKIRAEVERAR